MDVVLTALDLLVDPAAAVGISLVRLGDGDPSDRVLYFESLLGTSSTDGRSSPVCAWVP
ncbi:MAG: hypothetical protein U0166_19205 [Acidobacteriota bacterium]